MSARAGLVIVGCALACRPAPARLPLARAGACDKTACDDGAGELARASAQLVIGDEGSGPAFAETRAHRTVGDPYGGDPYGAAMYGGDPYGGIEYAGYSGGHRLATVGMLRRPRYAAAAGLTGAVEGTVSWSGPAPARAACGAPRIAADRGLGGVLVYVEHVSVGRILPNGLGRPASVGGTVSKHGCALLPAAQIVTPLPSTLMIHGDAQRATVKVRPPVGEPKAFELQEAGVIDVDLEPGVTRVDADDGKLAAAWIVAIDTPYYAITDDAGRFRLDELAPGTYELTFWQAPIPILGANGVLTYGVPTVAHRTVKVDAKLPVRLTVSLGK